MACYTMARQMVWSAGGVGEHICTVLVQAVYRGMILAKKLAKADRQTSMPAKIMPAGRSTCFNKRSGV